MLFYGSFKVKLKILLFLEPFCDVFNSLNSTDSWACFSCVCYVVVLLQVIQLWCTS